MREGERSREGEREREREREREIYVDADADRDNGIPCTLWIRMLKLSDAREVACVLV